jgi:MT0933-like antitoxin protein
MGFMDWFKRGEKTVAENKETVTDGIEKAADVADDKTGGQYTEHIDQGAETAQEYVQGLDEEG